MMWCSRGCAHNTTTGQLEATGVLFGGFILIAIIWAIVGLKRQTKEQRRETCGMLCKVIVAVVFNVLLIAWILK